MQLPALAPVVTSQTHSYDQQSIDPGYHLQLPALSTFQCLPEYLVKHIPVINNQLILDTINQLPALSRGYAKTLLSKTRHIKKIKGSTYRRGWVGGAWSNLSRAREVAV